MVVVAPINRSKAVIKVYAVVFKLSKFSYWDIVCKLFNKLTVLLANIIITLCNWQQKQSQFLWTILCLRGLDLDV